VTALTVPAPADADPALGAMLQSYMACVCAELTSAGRPPCACCLVWGDSPPPADFCACDCADGSGQAWVRVVRWDPASISNRNTVGIKCQPFRLRVWLEAGVYRCVPAGDSQGNPPTCDQRSASAWGLINDARSLRKATECCQALDRRRLEFMTGDPMTVMGGCSGTSIQFTLDL
jgi:hypothetical protein